MNNLLEKNFLSRALGRSAKTMMTAFPTVPPPANIRHASGAKREDVGE
jgi:hypothetical protein